MFSHIKELFTRPSGYSIAKSVRLRSSAQGYLSKTLTTPTNNKKWTYSVWMKRGSLSANRTIMSSNVDGAEYWDMRFNTSDQIYIQNRVGSSNLLLANTTAVYRDPSAWYHIVFVFDSANATAANRNLLYVNGVNVSLSANSASSDASAWNTSGVQHNIGVSRTLTSGGAIWAEYDGYLTEINFIDGQALTPSSFGETDSITGVWKAKKYGGTYGTNGFYLNFSDNSNNTATTIGKDYSGNGNNWTPNNISVTAGATYDSMIDVPTPYADGGNGRGNYCVLNPLSKYSAASCNNGNLQGVTTTAAEEGIYATLGVSSGKWYFEATPTAITSGGCMIGIAPASTQGSQGAPGLSVSSGYGYYTTGNTYGSGGGAYGNTFTTNDVIGCALDLDNGKIYWSKNGTWQNSGNPATQTNPAFTGISGTFIAGIGNGGTGSSSTVECNFGQRPFTYTPPSGYVALNTYNLPASTISNGATVMAATIYTGTGSTQSITNTVNGVSMKPDFVWIKSRSNAENHNVVDSIRGAGVWLASNLTQAETNDTGSYGVSTFNSNGFTVISNGTRTNANTYTYVAWQWQAGQGSTSSNTSGSITSTVSVNATAGFSIVTYTGNGTNLATVGHSLGVAPKFVIIRRRDTGQNWLVDISNITGTTGDVLTLNTTNALVNSTTIAPVKPSSTVLTLGTDGLSNASSGTYVAYCWAAVAGFSAFGSYTGNGSTDGPFIYTGFRPRWVMIKRTDSADDWIVMDSSRNTYNVANSSLFPNGSYSETTDSNRQEDFLSNGFKVRSSPVYINASGGTYIYAAYAESPFKTSLAR